MQIENWITTMSKLVMSVMCYAHTMTTNATFEAVFVASNEIHMGYYIEEQWTMWQATPLMFAKKWPLQFRMMCWITNYARQKGLNQLTLDIDEDLEVLCIIAYAYCVKNNGLKGRVLRLE